MRQFWEVLVFSYRDRLRAKVFWNTTLFAIALLALLMSIPKLEAMFSDGEDQYVVVDQTGKYVDVLDPKEFTKNVSLSVGHVLWKVDETLLRDSLEDETADWEGYFLIEQPAADKPPVLKAIVKSMPSHEDVQSVQNYIQLKYTMQVAEKINMTPEQLQQLMGRVELEIATDLSQSQNESLQNNYIPVYAMIMFLSMSIIGFGSSVATSVAAEKGSRIMEVMITKVRPLWLMFGKITGVGLAGLTQIAIIAGTAFAISRLLYQGPIEIGGFRLDLSTLEVSMLIYFLVFYLLGYFFYATMFAAVGSLVSRSEEVNQVIMPITMTFMVAMYATMFAMSTPEHDYVVIASFVPIFTPMMMLVRVGMSDVPTIQVFASIAVLAISILVFCWLAAKIYRVGVLTYGKRPTWKEIYAAIKMYRV